MEEKKKLPAKLMRDSRAVKSSFVLPSDTNTHRTLFGGKLMSYIDDIAAISATKHARTYTVTASTDSVDFLHPIKEGYTVNLESIVTWTHKTSMEVFVKIFAENLLEGTKVICATSFLTFVALDKEGKPTIVPEVIPETREELFLHNTAPTRAETRQNRRKESERFAKEFGVVKPS
ncbi:acyl-CoA thioesterase [Pseudalkalibacillus caeni]|uniref:Acyl-CoA thioesterase n=1 Tax=Exobacillus caeni TaxID=2574798 RepID=A0A5R9FCX6_9BACL|nr:acyl-CoA thioesterase [Pseudalkalibacillus caeni]TLS37505.1 acyl-CoA thioesterase [Pseudalkalibacillus caeni]